MCTFGSDVTRPVYGALSVLSALGDMLNVGAAKMSKS